MLRRAGAGAPARVWRSVLALATRTDRQAAHTVRARALYALRRAKRYSCRHCRHNQSSPASHWKLRVALRRARCGASGATRVGGVPAPPARQSMRHATQCAPSTRVRSPRPPTQRRRERVHVGRRRNVCDAARLMRGIEDVAQQRRRIMPALIRSSVSHGTIRQGSASPQLCRRALGLPLLARFAGSRFRVLSYRTVRQRPPAPQLGRRADSDSQRPTSAASASLASAAASAAATELAATSARAVVSIAAPTASGTTSSRGAAASHPLAHLGRGALAAALAYM